MEKNNNPFFIVQWWYMESLSVSVIKYGIKRGVYRAQKKLK